MPEEKKGKQEKRKMFRLGAVPGGSGIKNRKIYKADRCFYINMFPSDPTGSLDDFFSMKIGGGLYGRNSGLY